MRRPFVYAGMLITLVYSQWAPADDWTVDLDASTLGFTATYDEIPFSDF